MSLPPTCRMLLASALTALAVPAWSQSFHHAPPTPPGTDALLPIITPGPSPRSPRTISQFSGHPSQPAALPAGATTAARPAAPGGGPLKVPAHLLANQWSRLREQPPAVPPAPQPIAVADRSVATPEPTPPKETVASADANRARSLAADSMARGDFAAAEKALAEAVERYPSDPRLAASLAQTRESRGDWAGAIQAYDVLVRLEPSEPRWRTRRAECFFRTGDFARATDDFRSAAASKTLSFEEYALYGDAALRSGDPATAEEAFAALARLKHEPLPQVELLRGLAALKQGKADEARGILLQANGRWPHDVALTEALRLASAIHYGDRPAYGDRPSVETAAGTKKTGDETIVATAAAESHAEEPADPVVSRWRKTRVRKDTPTNAESFEATPTPAEEPDNLSSPGWRSRGAIESNEAPATPAPVSTGEPRLLPAGP